MVEFIAGVVFGVLLSVFVEWRLSRRVPTSYGDVGPAPLEDLSIPKKGRTMWDREDPYVPKD